MLLPELTCGCRCHDRAKFSRGADIYDPADAALACDVCRPVHCPALLERRLANDPEPRSVSIAEFCAWQDDATGEGSE